MHVIDRHSFSFPCVNGEREEGECKSNFVIEVSTLLGL